MKLFKLISAAVFVLNGFGSDGYAQQPIQIDVKQGSAAEAINDELVRRSKDGLNGGSDTTHVANADTLVHLIIVSLTMDQ